VLLAGCGAPSAGNKNASSKTTGVTINVVLAAEPPPKVMLDEFTKATGINVNWTNLDWDSLQTKISAAAAANTYFADATNVDWSRVGQLGKLGWFTPMETFLDTGSMKSDMPQLASFTSDGHVVGLPYDASFMVTTVNQKMFKAAGVNEMPKTIADYTAALNKVKSSGIAKTPLNIPFAAAEGLSTYWYETTAAFGGTVLDAAGKPQFTSPDSAGYQAAKWMVDAIKNGLVPAGNINVTDSQGQQTLMANGQVASTFSDYSGTVGTLYDVDGSSKVTGEVQYLPTPGVDGPMANLSNPDAVGVPKQAKYPDAAAKFIEWFTSADTQAAFSGLDGPDKIYPAYALPSHVSAVDKMVAAGKLAGGDELVSMLKGSQPVFEGGAPTWYPKFSNAVYTSLHAAATGSMSVQKAIDTMSKTAEDLASGS
jgi:multiple sugar transport system substrate-binding protein